MSASQFKNHQLDALTTGELTGPPKAAGYAIRPVRALQHRDRDELKNMLQLGIRDMDLLKFEKRGNEIICSIIPAADSTLSEEEVEIS